MMHERYDEFRNYDIHMLVVRGAMLRRTTAWSYNQILDHLVRHEEPRDTELAAIARDGQSVHLTAVSTQTNKGLDVLYKFVVPADQNTMAEIRAKWTTMFTGTPVEARLYDDMQLWYNRSWCREEGDYMYKRVLDHAWAAIKTRSADEQRTLNIRLQQECAESYGMCCDGHINRIINTFVGFIDDIAPSIPIGEILQHKMAQVSEIEDLEERILRATLIFHELGVNAEQAGPWLEALA
jgi:hypothetical protein